MVINNKKGFDYSALLVIVAIIVLAALFLAIYTISDRHDFTLGETQSVLLNTFYSSESMLLFVDQAAKYSAYHTLSELPDVDIGCGKINDIISFNKKENPLEICYFDFINEFKIIFNKKLNDYFSKSEYKIPKDNYEFLLFNDSIKAIALEPAYVGIFMPKRKTEFKFLGITFKEYPLVSYQFGRYYVKPSFSLDLNHNIFFYDIVQNRLNKTITDCALKFNTNQTSEKITCINNDLKSLNYKMQTDNNETFVFEFPQNIINPFDKKDLNIKMAVYIPYI